MATGTAALAQKLVGKKPTASAEKKATKKANSQKKNGSAKSSRKDIPWQKIADLYNSGMSVGDISDKLGLTRLKTKKGKENPYPYYLTVGYLGKLANGVEVDGKKISIVRGSKNKKRVAARKEE